MGDCRSGDESERRAQRILDKEQSYDGVQLHSVYNEPGFLPSQQDQAIEADWTCSRCGYNLRGLRMGHPCPECGLIELYAPPPKDAPSYGSWVQTKSQHLSKIKSWTSILVASLLMTPTAVVGAVMNSPMVAWLTLFIIWPVTEQALKMAAVCWLVESRPYLVRRASQLLVGGVLCGLSYAALENVLCLYVYANPPSSQIEVMRWMLCPAIHGACSLSVAMGLVQVWRRPMIEGRPPKVSLALPMFVLAVVLHSVYNATMLALGYGALLI